MKKRRKEKEREQVIGKQNRMGQLFVAPPVVLFLAFTLIPMIMAVGMSFTKYDVINPPTFAGLGNFKKLFHDEFFWIAMKNTCVYTLLYVPLGLLLSLGAALEYYRICGKQEYLKLAEKIARRAVTELAGADQIFNMEGKDDCGLFRGIYFRYLCELIREEPEREKNLAEVVELNAEAVKNALNKEGLIGNDWRTPSEGEIDLAQHLSGVMVLEMRERLQAAGGREEMR